MAPTVEQKIARILAEINELREAGQSAGKNYDEEIERIDGELNSINSDLIGLMDFQTSTEQKLAELEADVVELRDQIRESENHFEHKIYQGAVRVGFNLSGDVRRLFFTTYFEFHWNSTPPPTNDDVVFMFKKFIKPYNQVAPYPSMCSSLLDGRVYSTSNGSLIRFMAADIVNGKVESKIFSYEDATQMKGVLIALPDGGAT